MSETTTTAKPRPRPKPKPKKAAETQPTVAGGSNGHSQLGDPDDEDSMFLIKRDWNRAPPVKKKPRSTTRATSTAASSDVELLDDEQSTPRPSKPQRKKKRVERPDQRMARLMSEEFSDHDESSDGLEIIESGPTRPNMSKLQKRKRSRSRSITPPPAISSARLETAKNLVRQALNTASRRAASPTAGDDSVDGIILDPELAKIAREMRAKPALPRNPSQNGGPEAAIIRVRWKPHPKDTESRVQTWGFKIKRHDTLKALFTETSKQAEVSVDDLIISYDNNRLFTSATPHSLSILAEAEFEACIKSTYDYVRSHRHDREGSYFEGHGSPNGREPSRTRSLSPETDAGAEDGDRTPAPEGSGGGDSFKLFIRFVHEGQTKEVSLNVRQTTTCGAIIGGFLKKAKLEAQYKGKATQPRLMIDGDKMDPEIPISEAELEDGDKIEVADL